jgi:hypothetical protein
VANDQNKKTFSRRGALTAISASVCAAMNLPRAARAASWCATPVAAESAARLFTKAQMETVAALSEIIIPADEHSPGAKAAGVDRFIDEIVAVSDQPTKDSWVAGLAAVDRLARTQFGKPFVSCSPDQQLEIVRKMSLGEANPSTLEERFFVSVKRATVDGYYNSEIGIHADLHYQGNTYLPEFKGCTHARPAAVSKPGRK